MSRLTLAVMTGAAGFAIAAAAALASPVQAQTRPGAETMQIESSYPVIVTDKLQACRDFYVRHLGFEVAFEASWFVYLSSGGDTPYAIAFMSPDHPSQPPGPERFNGEGMFVTLQVADAAAEFKRLQDAGVAIAYPLKDEDWGQRRFGLYDPAGVWVDVVQQIEPATGYWDQYKSGVE